MIDIEAQGFSSKFTPINNLNELHFSYIKFLRCYATASYSELTNNILNFIEKGAQALNYLEIQKGFIGYNSKYYSLEKSDKDVISYRTGETLLKLFSEAEMDIEKIIKLNNPSVQITPSNSSVTKTQSKSIGSTSKKAKEPDFIGIDTNDNYHVLESKCRAQYSTSEHQHGINQVLTVDKVNNASPLTKTACYFTLTKNKARGNIIDPDGQSSFNITFPYSEFIQGYYEPFTSFNSENSIIVRFQNRRFFIIPFIGGKYYIGIDQVVKQRSTEGEFSEDFRNWYAEMDIGNEITENNYISVGADGIILVDFRSFLESRVEVESLPEGHWIPYYYFSDFFPR